jgi:hypothetical protein
MACSDGQLLLKRDEQQARRPWERKQPRQLVVHQNRGPGRGKLKGRRNEETIDPEFHLSARLFGVVESSKSAVASSFSVL